MTNQTITRQEFVALMNQIAQAAAAETFALEFQGDDEEPGEGDEDFCAEEGETAWRDHVAAMQAGHDAAAAAAAAELVALGWTQAGPGRDVYYQQAGERLVLRRQLGSPVWYTTAAE